MATTFQGFKEEYFSYPLLEAFFLGDSGNRIWDLMPGNAGRTISKEASLYKYVRIGGPPYLLQRILGKAYSLTGATWRPVLAAACLLWTDFALFLPSLPPPSSV